MHKRWCAHWGLPFDTWLYTCQTTWKKRNNWDKVTIITVVKCECPRILIYLNWIDKFLLQDSGKQCPLFFCSQTCKLVPLGLQIGNRSLLDYYSCESSKIHLLLVYLGQGLPDLLDVRGQVELPCSEQFDRFVCNLGVGIHVIRDRACKHWIIFVRENWFGP